jgi:glycine/D-amino acid oxidase-like deaminating enzyme
MVKTWKADSLFPRLIEFYKHAETLTGGKFFFSMPVYRPFVSIAEQNEWMGKSADEAYRDYIEQINTNPVFDTVKDTYGGIVLKQCGYVNTAAYIDAVRKLICTRGLLLEKEFDENLLTINDDAVNYNGHESKRIIFCQGVKSLQNPWFGRVPVKPLKGETLTIKSSWKKDVILNRGVYIVPGKHPSEWKVGATYNVKDKMPGITPEARKELEEKLDELAAFPYEVIGQNWGQRPTTADRRPVLGGHPHYKPLIIFNGLGTKGISLAPYFSDQLIQWLENEGEIDKDVNVTRFKLLY